MRQRRVSPNLEHEAFEVQKEWSKEVEKSLQLKARLTKQYNLNPKKESDWEFIKKDWPSAYRTISLACYLGIGFLLWCFLLFVIAQC